MFFMLSFSFVVILNKFDTNDGLRRLYNVVSEETAKKAFHILV